MILHYFAQDINKPDQLLLRIDVVAGIRKSILIDLLSSYLSYYIRLNTLPLPVLLVALTWVAAFNISGNTIYDKLALPIQKNILATFDKKTKRLKENFLLLTNSYYWWKFNIELYNSISNWSMSLRDIILAWSSFWRRKHLFI